MADAYTTLALQELARLLIQKQPPNGHNPSDFGPYGELISALHDTYRDSIETNELFAAAGKPTTDLYKELTQTWDIWARRPEFQELAQLLTAANIEDDPDSLDWLRASLNGLPTGLDGAELRRLIDPILKKLISLSDEPTVIVCLEELRRFFKWNRDTFQAYRDLVIKGRRAKAKAARPETADVLLEDEALGETEAPPTFLSPALAYHNGVVYVSQMMAFKATSKTKHGNITESVWRPIIITSDRRRIAPRQPAQGSPVGSITWLDEGQRLALTGGLSDAPSFRWSYGSITGFLNGSVEYPKAHEVFDSLMASLKKYVYHADETSYTVDVLWAMGTYFYRLWNAYPYLALHGEKGAGKSTLLTWLAAICFNAEFLVNTSEASLYRSIESKALTLLIDEQEGLNSSKAAKENKADLMGILKSGYKTGAKVARQDMDQKEITRYFDVYSPKALAAIELFEDVLENRAILTYMVRKPKDIELVDESSITTGERELFGPLRDQLYLLLMSQAENLLKITARVQMDYHNRMRELLRPLYAIAALVDLSRGEGRQTLNILEKAAEQKAELRDRRDRLTSEATLREALRLLCTQATTDESDLSYATLQSDGLVLVDSLQVREMFGSLFSSEVDSFYNDHWFGKQAEKMGKAVHSTGKRRRRKVPQPFGGDPKVIQVSTYLLDPTLV